ncbi:hypothetical protein AU196_23380 [Mycobacterium sp. IS-1742]|uniref:DUF2306 domain-containing protein n=1 Tax=Mycobacterium sp. IS-1742 TaxID=1772285 RepID=UPI00073FE32E|nr:DUF2306 domain-containing protein [Mycobacterium sp. IS-1742]KUI25733.1 hypothetical protein AU196_23380 [Mycobacterium sp. IS-1742]
MTYASAPGRRPSTPLILVVLAAAGFLAYSVPPYLTGGSRVPPTFTLHHPLLVAHVLLATVAMLAVVAQMCVRRPRVHPWIGRVYVVTAVPAAASALVIGALTPFGPLLAVSNVVLATLWLWFTVGGYRHARGRRFGAHRRHMLCSAVLALSVISNRVWTPVLFVALYPLRDSVFQSNDEHYLWLVAGLGGWLGWLLPLTLLNVWLRRHDPEPSPVRRGRQGRPV